MHYVVCSNNLGDKLLEIGEIYEVQSLELGMSPHSNFHTADTVYIWEAGELLGHDKDCFILIKIGDTEVENIKKQAKQYLKEEYTSTYHKSTCSSGTTIRYGITRKGENLARFDTGIVYELTREILELMGVEESRIISCRENFIYSLVLKEVRKWKEEMIEEARKTYKDKETFIVKLNEQTF